MQDPYKCRRSTMRVGAVHFLFSSPRWRKRFPHLSWGSVRCPKFRRIRHLDSPKHGAVGQLAVKRKSTAPRTRKSDCGAVSKEIQLQSIALNRIAIAKTGAASPPAYCRGEQRQQDTQLEAESWQLRNEIIWGRADSRSVRIRVRRFGVGVDLRAV
jgi:hypothetical protein